MAKPFMFTALSVMLLTQTGCFGSFVLVRKVYEWNKEVSSNKFLQSIVFFGLAYIIPVYGFAGLIDAVVLNLIEFWTGTNPVSMTEGQREEQMVMGKDGIAYKIIATKNQFQIVALSGKKMGKDCFIRFDENDKSWSYADEKTTTKLVQIKVAANNEIVGFNYFGKNGATKDVSVAEVENAHNQAVAAHLQGQNNLAASK